MSTADLSERELLRLRLVLGGMLAFLALLAVCLWRMQVGQGARYEDSLERQSVRRVRIPSIRGKIFDRHGLCLADNQPNYCVAIYLEEMRSAGRRRVKPDAAWGLVQRLAEIIDTAPQLTCAQVEDHLRNCKALPLVAWQRVDEAALAKLSENALDLPAVDIIVDASRVYPQAALAGHLLGYVGPAAVTNAEEKYHYYLPDLAGQSGVEKFYDRQLAGKAGGRLVRVDVSGFKHNEVGFREPVPGRDLLLAIDARIQRSAEKAVADCAGAVVVLDPRNGEVLALVSAPGVDPNIFCRSMSVDTWNRIVADPRHPLVNRALAGVYAPGSVFKPVVALAALELGRADAQTVFECPGYFDLGGQHFACHMNDAHGQLDIRKALELSCNVFFFQLGLKCGFDGIYQTALAMGFGARTGIDLDEAPGLLPGKAWKRRVLKEAWCDGDTCNVSIGQGALQVTCLQMAVLIAAIANGGRVYPPRILLGERDQGAAGFQMLPTPTPRNLGWNPENLALVREGLRAVIQEPTGTGHAASLPDMIMAGKTGTAEYGRKGAGQKHGWMILFAPFDQPRYAVAMVLDDAISGGISIGPRLRQLMSDIFAGEAGGRT